MTDDASLLPSRHAIRWSVLRAQLCHLEAELEPLKAVACLDLSRALLQELTVEVVDEARRTGSSWADIGKAVGMTKQGAWLRFAGTGPLSGADL